MKNIRTQNITNTNKTQLTQNLNKISKCSNLDEFLHEFINTTSLLHFRHLMLTRVCVQKLSE